MSGLIYLPKKLILVVGLLVLVTHNLFDNMHVTGNNFSDFLLAELHQRRRFNFGGHFVTTGYSLLPWLSTMMLGYCFGTLYKKETNAALRKKYLLLIGSTAIAIFILIWSINIYGDMNPWEVQPSFIMIICSFLNVTKYPPSLVYTLMTLGPALIVLASLEQPLNSIGKIIIPIGRVPLFFYILHLFLIHLLAIIAVVASGRPWTQMVFTTMQNAKDSPWLKGYGFSLAQTYLVWIVVVLLLYPLCKWYDRYKTNHKEKWWLSYF